MRLLLALALLANLAWGDIKHSAEYQEIHGNGTYTAVQERRAERKLRRLERQFLRQDEIALAEKTNRALRGLFHIAVLNLRLKGFQDTAIEVEQKWAELDGEIVSIVSRKDRDITHFAPWSNALALLYVAIEFKLGYSLCYILRLTDIATYVWTPPIIFHPCQFPKEEFLKHFAGGDPKYQAFFPATAFWSTNITCTILTFGAGSFWACSPIATLVELGAEKWLAPKLGNWMFDRLCGGGDHGLLASGFSADSNLNWGASPTQTYPGFRSRVSRQDHQNH